MKKRLSLAIALLLLFQCVIQLPAADRAYAAADDRFEGTISIALESRDRPAGTGHRLDAVLGREHELAITLTNTHATAWAHNVGIALTLPDGLEVGLSAAVQPSSVTAQGDGTVIAYWRDVKDLAPTEEYTFTVKLRAMSSYRATGNVPFDTMLNAVVGVYASDNARQLYEAPDAPVATADVPYRIVPFTIQIDDAGEHVKGAGPDANPPESGDEYGAFGRTIRIENNTRSASTFATLRHEADGALQIYGFGEGGTTAPISETIGSGGERIATWASGMTVAANAVREISFKAAFLNEHPDGSLIMDGTTVENQVVYTGSSEGYTHAGNVAYTAVAKDAIVDKSVTPGPVGYGDTLAYTINVVTNEYYPVTNVVVTDTIGDGQSFDSYSGTAGAPASPLPDGDGKTVITWSPGTVDKRTSLQYSYETTVEENWHQAYSGAPVYAGDRIENRVELTGTSLGNFQGDSDYTEVYVKTPSITERIIAVNGTTGLNSSEESVTVGDVVTFEVKYDATGIDAKQHNVVVYDYLPLGTLPDANGHGNVDNADLSQFQLNGVTPEYEAGSLLLAWNLGNLDESTTELTANVRVVVQNSTAHVAADKGAENLVNLSFRNSPERIESKRASVKLAYVEPKLTIARTTNGSSTVKTVVGGDVVTIVITVANTGSTTAYDPVYTETLPPELTSVTPQAGCGVVGSVLTCDSLSDIPAGGSVTITYTATIITPIGASYEIRQGSNVTYNAKPDPSTIQRSYTTTEAQHLTLRTEAATVVKTWVDSTANSQPNSKDNVRVGDWSVYKLDVTVPANVHAYEGVLTDNIATNQSFLKLFSDYDPATNTGTEIGSSSYTTPSNTVRIPFDPAVTPGGTYTYYVMTRINQVTTGYQQTQQSRAKFDWRDKQASGTARSAQSANAAITVKLPNLTSVVKETSSVPDTPASVTMGQDDIRALTYKVTNTGVNTAYDLIPSVTLRPGFRFTDSDGEADTAGVTGTIETGLVKTYAKTDLAAEGILNYNFHIELVSLEGAGTTHPVIGMTNAYYATHEAYLADTDGDTTNNPTAHEKFAQHQAQGIVTSPSVTLTNAISDTSNGDSLSVIRAGDTVNYVVTTTVPAGTQAYDVTVVDTFEGIGSFEVVGYTMTPASLAEPTAANWNAGTLTYVIGDVNASSEEKVFRIELQLRAKKDADKPAVGSYGTTAKATWHVDEAATQPMRETPVRTTSIAVIEPSVTIAADPVVNRVFSDANPEIEVGFTVTNSGVGDAYETRVELPIPEGLRIIDGSINEGGTYAAATRIVAWTGLTVGASNGTKTLKLTVAPQTADGFGAGTTAIELEAELARFQTTPNDAGLDPHIFEPELKAKTELSVAPATLTNVLTTSTNGGSTTDVRTGDKVTYTLQFDLPGSSPAYDVVLKNSGLTQLKIESVSLNGGTPIAADEDGNYPLGDIAADAEIVVVTQTRTDTNLPQNSAYLAGFLPTVEYRAADGGTTALTATDDQESIDVLQPLLTVQLNADKTLVKEPGETVTVSMSVYNRLGTSTAYNGNIIIPLPPGVTLSGSPTSSDSNDTITTSATDIRWTLAPLDANPASERTLTFIVTADPDTEVATYLPFTAELVSYSSLPEGEGKTYGPVTANQVGVEVGGDHALQANGSGSLTAGKSKQFNHILTNTGAGLDRFTIKANGPFPLDLYIGGIKAATGSLADGIWTWSEIADAYEDNGEVSLALEGGAAYSITLHIHVPVTTPYGDTAYVTELTAAATVTGSVYSNQDTLIVTGIPLEGWTGAGVDPIPWTMPVYGHTDGVVLQAVSAVHVSTVKAFHKPDASGPMVETVLTLANPTTYINDGFKRWSAVYLLPDHVEAGEKPVTFIAYTANDTQLETDAPASMTGINNSYKLQASLHIEGTILDALTGDPIPNAEVTLYDPFNDKVVNTTTADDNGYYRFEDVDVDDYEVKAEAVGYSDHAVGIYAIAPNGLIDTITVDVELSPYRITLEAIPATILGDGVSTTRLVSRITDFDGNPLEGVTVVFASPQNRGTFPDGTTAVTNADGQAEVRFRSEAITGIDSVRFPVTAEVNDPVRNLAAKDEIVITFDPGAVTGIVTEIVNGVSVPVVGATVVVKKDFDGDGELDFYVRTVTDANGRYQVAIPRGNTVYDVTITKDVMIGGVRQQATFPQTAQAGVISAQGYELFPATQAMGGILLAGDEQRSTAKLSPEVYGSMIGYLLDSNGNVVLNGGGDRLEFTFDGTDGTFAIPNAPNGTYSLVIAYDFGTEGEIIVNRKSDGTYPRLVVTQNGEMNLSSELIDPYGIVTDSVTGLPIPGAHVELLYADTPRNVTSGRTPHTLVVLPILPGFAPNNNASPQDTDATGFYAYMVYAYTDYYLRVTKPGYHTYISPTIPVETAIVEHNLEMDPVLPPSFVPMLPPIAADEAVAQERDLAVELYTDRPIYPEGGTIAYKLLYKNRSAAVKEAFVAFRIPAGLTVKDAGTGAVTDGVIRFELGDLEAGAAGERAFTLTAPADLTQAEVLIDNAAVIGSADELVNPEDDRSTVRIMIFSDRFGEQKHVRYTKGYPDGNWLPNRSITRAEIAAIFARIMELEDTVQGVAFYKDVPNDLWAAEYIEAVTRKGLFGGYADGSFKPNQAISRAELSTVIYRYLNLQQGPVIASHFSDTEGNWAEGAIEAVYRHHIITGYQDGTFKPNELLIRTEAVAMINRLLHRGPLNGAEQSFPDMPKTHWAFGHVEESAVTHHYVRNADGSEQVTKVIPEPLW